MSSPIETYATLYNIPATTENPVRPEFATSTITLVDPPTVPLPHTPTPEPVHTPTERPHLTIAPDSDTEEGKSYLAFTTTTTHFPLKAPSCGKYMAHTAIFVY